MTDELDKMHLLSQPLLTEEGFVNPACMNELENVIMNMSETYDRLKDDPEWGEQLGWTFISNITGSLARWAVNQSSYSWPDDLDVVIKYLHECLAVELEKLPDDLKHQDRDLSGMYNITLCEINKLLHDILDDDPYVMAWNEPKVSSGPGYEKRHECPHPDFGFIDLSALFRNVCLDFRNDRRRNKAFDERFEAENGGPP